MLDFMGSLLACEFPHSANIALKKKYWFIFSSEKIKCGVAIIGNGVPIAKIFLL